MTALNPLAWNVPIVDEHGSPTPEFQRKWLQQQVINETIPELSTLVEVSAVLDVIGSTRGSVLYRGAGGWRILPPGTAGFALTSGGTGADPIWAAAGIQSLLDSIGNTQGDILYRSASGWVVLPPGTAGDVLQTGGAGANPAWATSGGTRYDWNDQDASMTGFYPHQDGKSNTGMYTVGSDLAIRSITSKAPNSGKFYLEYHLATLNAGSLIQLNGVGYAAASLVTFVGNDVSGWGMSCDARSFHGGSSATQAGYAQGDVVGLALDTTNSTGSIKFFKNNAAQTTAYTGLTFSAALFAMQSMRVGAANQAPKIKLCLRAADQAFSPPVGYSSWL